MTATTAIVALRLYKTRDVFAMADHDWPVLVLLAIYKWGQGMIP